MIEQPLSDLRVIDLTHYIAGPYCTKLLADFGADVIKIERPDGGDPARLLGPFPGDVVDSEKSGVFLHLNTNKRSVTINLKTAAGRDILHGLLRQADLLVESFRPGVMARLGLDPQALLQTYPNMVITSISNFGQTGPYRDYHGSELVLFALAGRMNRVGQPERYPLKLAANHVQYQAGNVGAMASLFAWFGQSHRGMGGQHVDVAISETQLASMNWRLTDLLVYAYTGERGGRVEMAIAPGYPSGRYPCADGWVNVGGGWARFPRIAALLGLPAEDAERFGSLQGQASLELKEEFELTIWLPWVLERTRDEAVEALQALEIQASASYTVDEVAASPQLAARQYFVEVDHLAAGRLRHLGAIAKTEDNWWRLRRPTPLLGQHTQEVLEGLLGRSLKEITQLRKIGVI